MVFVKGRAPRPSSPSFVFFLSLRVGRENKGQPAQPCYSSSELPAKHAIPKQNKRSSLFCLLVGGWVGVVGRGMKGPRNTSKTALVLSLWFYIYVPWHDYTLGIILLNKDN